MAKTRNRTLNKIEFVPQKAMIRGLWDKYGISLCPFGEGRVLYTAKTVIAENPEIEYDDGMRTLYLFTKGKWEPKREDSARHCGLWNTAGWKMQIQRV